MRVALLADVHSNLEALRAVLDDADAWGAEAVICAGDVVGYGPDPEACVELLVERGASMIAGNHELMLLGRLDFSRCVHAGIRATLWTREVLSAQTMAYLAELPLVATPLSGLVVCHGSLRHPEEYLASPGRAEAALGDLGRCHPGAGVLVCGHTHRAMLYAEGANVALTPSPGTELSLDPGARWLINPGAVGQSRDARALARYARLDLAARTVLLRELAYPHRRTVTKLRTAGLVARVAVPPPTGVGRAVESVRTRWARYRAERHRAPS